MPLGPALWAALALAPPADASHEEVSALRLRWDVPGGCPDEAALRIRVAGYLDDGVPVRALAARGTIRVDGERWTLRLHFDGRTKELSATSCEDLAEAASVILSLALAPHDPVTPSGGVRPASTVPAAANEPARAEPRPASRAAARVRSVVRAQAGVGVGITPTLTTARLATGVAWARARVELAGTLWTPADGPSLRAQGSRELVTMGSVQARGCGVLPAGALSIPLCGGLAMGALRVDDTTPAGRQVTHRLWAGVAGSAALVWRFSRYARLWAGPEVTVGLTPISVPLAGSPQPYRAGRVGGRASIGIELHFPSRPRARAGNTTR